MNYTASVTLTGVDNLSKILGNATTALDRLRLTALGANAPINALNQRLATFTGNQAQVSAMTNQIMSLSQSLNQLAQNAVGLRGLTTNLNQLARVNNGSAGGAFHSSHINTFTDAITGGMRALSLFYVRARNIGQLFLGGLGLRQAASEAIEFYSALETSRLSIAASLLTFKTYRDEQGNTVAGARAYTMALGEASQAQELLRSKVFDTTATFSELVVGYQKVVAAAGKSSATQEDFAQLTVNMSNMATAWGMSLETISNQFQSTLLGVSRVSSRVGGFIRALGVSPEQIRSWKQQGVLVQELNKLLVEFGKIGGDLQNTWKGITSNIEDAFQNVFGEGFKSTILEAGRALQTFTAQLVDVSATRSSGKIQINQEVLDGVKGMSDIIAEMIQRFSILIPTIVQLGLVVGETALRTIRFFTDAAINAGRFLVWLKDLAVGFANLIGLGDELKDLLAVFNPAILASFALELGVVIGGYVLAQKAVYQLELAQKSLAVATLTTRQAMNTTFTEDVVRSISQIGSNAAGAAARFVSMAASAALIGGAIGIAAAAVIELTAHVVDLASAYEEEFRAAGMTKQSIDNMMNSARKNYQLSLDQDVASKLVVIGHTKARAVLASLHDQYKIGRISIKEYNEALGRLNSEQEQNESDKLKAKSLRDMNRELDALRDKTGKVALQNELAIAQEKLIADAMKQNRIPTMEEMNKLLEIYRQKLKNAQDQEAAKANKGTGLGFSFPDMGKMRDRLGELQELMTKAGEAFSKAMGGGKDTNDSGVDDQLIQFQGKQKQLWELIRLSNQLSRIGHDNTLLEIEDDRLAAQSKIDLVANAAKANIYYKENEAERARANQAIEDARVRVNNEANNRIQRYNADTAKRAKQDYESLYATAKTYTDGVAAAYVKLYSTVKTEGQITADLLSAQFNTTSNFIGDNIFNALTGKFDDIAKSFTKLTDGFAESWTKAISETVKNWLLGVDQMGAAGPSTYDAATNSTSGLLKGPSTGQYVNKYLQGAASGYATGSGVGSASGAPGFSTGATVGGVAGGVAVAALSGTELGSALGPWGALIGAIVGAIVGVISAPNTENHMFIGSGGKTYKDATGAITSQFGVGTPLADNPISGNIKDIGNSMAAGLAEAFKSSGAKGDWADWVKSVNQVIGDYIRSLQFEIHAGSDEDMKKDLEYLLKGIIPREMLYGLFGVLKAGKGPDVGGISGSSPYSTSNGFNTTAPLYKLFSSLGFSADKIKEIADQISTTDPEVFLTRVKSLLGVVGNINALVSHFSGGKQGALDEISSRASTTQADTFKKVADNIITLFQSLNLYSGEEQLKKAEEANQAANQYWEEQLAAIEKIQTLARDITASIGSQISSMQNARLGKDAGWLNSDRRARLDQIMPNSPDWGLRLSGELGGATDPAKIGALAAEAQALIAAIFDDLNQKLAKARDLQAQVASGFGELANRMSDVIAGKGADWITADKRRRIGEIGGLISGTNDPTALGNLAAEAKQLISDVFSSLEDSLKNIKSIAEQFATSIASQLASMKEGRLGKNTRAQNYSRLDQLIPLSPFELDNPGLIGSTTDPAQLQKLGKEAQDLIAAIFSDLLAQLQRTSALKSDFAGLLEKFTGVFDSSPTGMSGYLERVGKLQADVAHAATLSGTEQLDALDKVKESALALYDEQARMLEAIKTNMADLTSSIDKQISNITDQFSSSAEGQGLQETLRQLNQIKFAGGKLTDSQQQQYDQATNQLGNVMREEGAKKAWDEIQRLKASIGTASSPEEVKRITEEIQQQSSKYLGFFREDDPRRQEASGRIVGELQATKELATAAYKEMEAQIKAANEAIKNALTSATTLLTGSMTATQAEMEKLEAILIRLDGVLKDQLAVAAAAVVAQMVALQLVMDSLAKQIDKQFTAIIVTTQKEIEKLEGYLKLLNATVSEKLNATIDSLVLKNGELAAAIDLAKKAFTEVTTVLMGGGGVGTSGGGSGSGGGKGEGQGGEGGSGGGHDVPTASTLVSSFKSITTSGNDVVSVIDSLALSGRALIGVIDGITKGLGGATPTSGGGGGGTKGTGDVVSYIKNNPSVLNTRTR